MGYTAEATKIMAALEKTYKGKVSLVVDTIVGKGTNNEFVVVVRDVPDTVDFLRSARRDVP